MQKVLLGTGAPITTSDRPVFLVRSHASLLYNHICGQSYCQDYVCVRTILLR